MVVDYFLFDNRKFVIASADPVVAGIAMEKMTTGYFRFEDGLASDKTDCPQRQTDTRRKSDQIIIVILGCSPGQCPAVFVISQMFPGVEIKLKRVVNAHQTAISVRCRIGRYIGTPVWVCS